MGNIYCVLGPPCGGKSTYVAENAKEGDVVVDYDLIARSLGSKNSHDSSGAIRSCAFAARKAAIDLIMEGIDSDSWIIHTSPKKEDIEKYTDAGAEFVEINPGKEVCLERAKDRPARTAEVIEAWYEQNSPKSLASMIMAIKV